MSPKLTVTTIEGGESHSIIPDRCSITIDVRLTTTFDKKTASELIASVAADIDERWQTRATKIAFKESWPAYGLDEAAPIRLALSRAAQVHLPHPVLAKVAGPSNIGNFLASLGIDATAGLGVRYEGLHGTDERIDLTTIPAVQATYHDAILELLSVERGTG